MLTKIERGQEDFDLVCPSEYIIERMLKKDLLVPINRNFGKTPDYIPNISPYIQKELEKISQPVATPMITLFPTCGVPPEYSITRSSRPLKKSAPGEPLGAVNRGKILRKTVTAMPTALPSSMPMPGNLPTAPSPWSN